MAAGANASDLARWPGPHGGLPPVDRARPETFATAYSEAIEVYGRELDGIARNPAVPDFSNSVQALDRAGRDLRRLDAILQMFATARADDRWRALQRDLAPRRDALVARAQTDPDLFARVNRVKAALPASAPDAEAARLVELTHRTMQHAGAGLDDASRSRLAAIDARLARLEAEFGQNLQREDAVQLLVVRDIARLAGLPESARATAAETATARGHPGAHAFPVARPVVWTVLTHAQDRALRRELWSMWMGRGANPGPFDNRPVTAAILAARQEKAALLGYPSHGHRVLAARMISTPARAQALTESVWRAVLDAEPGRSVDLERLAAADGIDALKPWDRLYYLDKLAKARFGFEPAELADYFPLEGIRDAMFAAANDSYGYSFEPMPGVPTLDPDVAVYLVRLDKQPAGIVYLDLKPRPGKQPGSWTAEFRRAADGEAGELPVVGMYSSPPAGPPGQAMLLPYDYANVLFHEFGHVLHMLASKARFRGTGSLAVPWDFVEVPSLLNERWLLTDRTLDRLPHHRTGQAMPVALREKLRAWRREERVFSVNAEYLATALVDQHLHLAAARGPVDVVAVERETLARYAMPGSIDPMMRATHAVHTFSHYGAGVHTYLWSDMLAADLAQSFERAEAGFHDPAIGGRYHALILSRGAVVPVEDAVRAFLGRQPDEGALLRRFGLIGPAS